MLNYAFVVCGCCGGPHCLLRWVQIAEEFRAVGMQLAADAGDVLVEELEGAEADDVSKGLEKITAAIEDTYGACRLSVAKTPTRAIISLVSALAV